jgi:alkylhydroperoxidase family enzyme
MKPMYLRDVENNPNAAGPYAGLIQSMNSSGASVSQIMHLFAFKPEATDALSAFTQAVMRGPSPLSPGFRELIAAFTSKLNQCPF